MTYLRFICRTDKLNAVDEKLVSCCQSFGVILMSRNIQTYWKDEQCIEASYELSSDISNALWLEFFSDVFGADKNIVEQDSREITHNASPILSDTEVFAHLYIEEQDVKETAICDECGSEYLASSSQMASLCPECAHVLYGYENCNHVFKDGKCTLCMWDGSRSEYCKNLLDSRKEKQ